MLYPKEISTPAWRPFRAFMFVAMGLSAVAPILHGLKLYGYKQLEDQMGLSWVVLEGVLYITGAVLYAVRLITISRTFEIKTDSVVDSSTRETQTRRI